MKNSAAQALEKVNTEQQKYNQCWTERTIENIKEKKPFAVHG